MGIGALSDVATLERLIKKTGGLPVLVDGQTTWGHKLTRYVEAGEEPEVLVKFTAVKIPSAFVPTTPDSKSVTMDGVSYKIRSVESDEDDGAMSVLLLKKV